MKCPKCNYDQYDGNTECVNCGIIFAKFHAQQANPDYRRNIRKRARSNPLPHNVEPQGIKYIATGVLIGLLLAVWDNWFIQMTLGILVTLVHELGHTFTAWLFAIPAIPAFDFMHGGGLTINFDQKPLLLVALYLFGGFLLYSYRHNRQTLVLLVAFGLLHLLSVTTSLGNILILFMGHGVELIMATVFIYRGLTNTAIVHQIERPMYSTIGFYIVFHDMAFAWKLMNDAGYRIEYEAQKGGYHFGDFSRIAEQYLGVDLSVVAFIFLLCCLTVPVISFLSWRYQEKLLDWINDRLITRVA